MMTIRQRVLAIAGVAVLASTTASDAPAADPPDLFLEHLADFVWTGAGGNNTWENSANWTAPTFPPGYPHTIPTFPNDPLRIEDPDSSAEEVLISPVIGANLSGAFATDRTVNINGSNVTVAALKLGSSSAAVTTDVTSTIVPGEPPTQYRLIFENGEFNDEFTNPGDPGADPQIEPEPIWSFNQGRALIWSTGLAGTGKVNRISAPIVLQDGVDVEGDRDLHIHGDIYEGVIDRDGYNMGIEENLESSINNLLSGGKRLYIHGTIHTVGVNAAGQETSGDGAGGDRAFDINTNRGILAPPDPQNPPPEFTRQGTVEILGKFAGDGLVRIGAGNGNLTPVSTVILRGDSTGFEGRISINRSNIVIDNDKAFGDGVVKTGNPPQGFGFNYISTSDTRTISNPIQTAQWQTVRGGTSVKGTESFGDHSITFTGKVTNTNTRGWINLLPAGKTLTLNGPQYPLEAIDDVAKYDTDRIYTIDGTGKTVITGGILNRDPEDSLTPAGGGTHRGHFRVRGTGVVIVDWDNNQGMILSDPDNPQSPMIPNPDDKYSDYAGYTWMEGGNLHFAEAQDTGEGLILSRGGAVGVDSGVVTNTNFLTKFNSSSNPNITGLENFFLIYNTNESIYTKYSQGGLMLGTNEYGQNLNFTTGDLANAANMSLAAHEGGSTYEGTITPSSTVPVNPNTYQLGGGSGTLTLPNVQLVNGTATRHLLVTNGGEVRLEGANTYTGVTKVVRKLLPTGQDQAKGDARGVTGDDDGDATGEVAIRPTLTATKLENGGVASSIGMSSSAASNLQLHGGTLKYDGAAPSNTDRLFTVGSAGATVEASGSSPSDRIVFSSTAALEIDVAESRDAILSTGVTGDGDNTIFGLPGEPQLPFPIPFNTDDLVRGMRVFTSDGDFNPPAGGSPIRITSMPAAHVVQVGQPNQLESEEDNDNTSLPNAWEGYSAAGDIRTIQFGPAPQRTLTLAGDNQGDNTMAPLIGNAPASPLAATAQEIKDGYGTVAIRKTGTGKWILSNNNTYSGPTDVEQGTLIINGVQTGAGTTTVKSGATLGGGGTLGGPLLSSGTVAPGFNGTGTMTVNGNYTQGASATLAIEIGGTGAGAFDRLSVLKGADTVTGSIDGDYNEDGAVDAADYVVWRNLRGQMVQLANEGDDASPGRVDDDDYGVWKDNYGTKNIGLGLATVSGTINIDLINGFMPTAGNMFTILTANEGISAGGITLSGESAGFNLIVNPTSLVLHYLGAGSGSLLAGAVPEPGGVMLAGLAMFGLSLMRRRL